MSYILSALRKAEKERKGEKGLDLESWDDEEWEPSSRSSGMSLAVKAALGIICILLFAVLVMLYLLVRSDTSNDVNSRFELSDSSSPVSTDIANQRDFDKPDAQEVIVEPDSGFEAINQSYGKDDGIDPQLPIITGHLYFAANESLSRLFGETGSYRVGHQFDNGLKLIDISEATATFDYRGRIIEMPLN